MPTLTLFSLYVYIFTTQVNIVRVASFMVSACTQQILHAMSNPDQSRAAMDNPETRVVAARTDMYQKFTDIVNSDEMPDRCIINMTDFNGIVVDCSVLRGPALTMVQVSSIMRDVKRDMAKYMRNFEASGKGVNGSDDFERDCEFYDQFVHGNAVIFAVYLAWERGRNIPRWNSTLLPADQQLDVGVQGQGSNGIAQKRGRETPEQDKLDKMITMQSQFFSYALGEGNRASNASTTSDRMASLASLDAHMTLLQRLRKDGDLTADQRTRVDTKYDQVFDQIVAIDVVNVTRSPGLA